MTADPIDVVAEAIGEQFVDPRPFAEDIVDALRSAGLLIEGPTVEDVLSLLAERMTKSYAALSNEALHCVGRRESDRLAAKADGVALARSYVFDAWRGVS